MLIYRCSMLAIVLVLGIGLLAACDAAATPTVGSAANLFIPTITPANSPTNPTVGTTPITEAATSTPPPAATTTTAAAASTPPPATTTTAATAAATTTVSTASSTAVVATNTQLPTLTPATATTTQAATTTVAAATTTTAASANSPVSSQTDKWVVQKGNNIVLITSPHDAMQPLTIAHGTSPVFSLDGKRIAFIGPSSGNGVDSTSPIMVINLSDGTTQTSCAIPTQHTELINWSQDDTGFYYGRLSINVNTIYSCDLQLTTTTDEIGPWSNAGAIHDSTSDGGTLIQLVNHTQGRFSDVFYFKSGYNNIRNPTNVTNGANAVTGDPEHSYNSAAFSPDGKTIAVTGNGIYFVSVPGQISPWNKKVIALGQLTGRVVWSSDGKEVSVVIITKQGFRLDTYDVATSRLTSSLDNVSFVDRAKN